MFKKILIANRGEIAVRIMATCREMGIKTVAIYSDVDSKAQHVLAADEAYPIGPAPAAQSYLRIEAIIAVALQSGAEAIHPGYGFLSENAAFVEACDASGIVFIGPPASAMRLMGAKITARQLAQTVGAPTVPGYDGVSQDATTLQDEAERIGFPVLIKASAGGGGKGMRVVSNPADFLEQLAGARREARSAFGDDTVFLERLLTQPRHIEIQVLGDNYGNIIYLGERECSIQRRHQKIIEESPSVALTPTLRLAMGTTAVRIAQAAGYVNAGTLEFMLDTDHRFYFLEMNTRLQVEHPVTELVTGLDLVRHQIRVAAGELLGIQQEQVLQRGHAIEARIYAEDPYQNFLPSTGVVSSFSKPEGPGIRLDSGIIDGDEITQFYDPMIAKLIVYAENRSAAVERLQRALHHSVVLGVTTNISLLSAISTHPAFQQGDTHTHFIEEYQLVAPPPAPALPLPDEVLHAAALYELSRATTTDTTLLSANGHNPWKAFGPWRMVGETRTITYSYQHQSYEVKLRPIFDGEHTWHIRINTQPAQTISYLKGNNTLLVLKNGPSQIACSVAWQEDAIQVIFNGQSYRLQHRLPPTIELATHSPDAAYAQKNLTAPMAGTIVKIQALAGEWVAAHQVLIILSAMKMEHAITAPYEGKIRHIHYKEGAVVSGGAVLVEME